MMDHETLITYIKIVFPVLLVLLGGWLAIRKYLKEKNDKKELLVNVVFGDLTNILEHYIYAKNEIYLLQESEQEKTIRLRFSQFGKMVSLEKLDGLGNLSTNEIRELLQLNLRIRNTDLILQDMLDTNKKILDSDIARLKSRMSYCAKTALNLLESISKQRKELKNDFKIIKTRLNLK